jgi:hypothetical protein
MSEAVISPERSSRGRDDPIGGSQPVKVWKAKEFYGCQSIHTFRFLVETL